MSCEDWGVVDIVYVEDVRTRAQADPAPQGDAARSPKRANK